MRSAGRPGPVFGAGLLLVSGAVLTLAAYRPALRAGFVFDDEPNIVYAEGVHWTELSLSSVKALPPGARLPQRAIANATFGLNHLVGGLNPYGYHLANVLIHLAVGAALAWVIVLYLAEGGVGARRDARLWAGVAAVTLFWVHPLNTQAVTYVVQRMTSLAALFCLLSFGLYLVGRERTGARSSLPWIVGALVSWILALGSKEIAFALPLVLVLWEACFRRGEWRERWSALDPRSRTGVVVAATTAVVILALVARGMGAGSLSWSGPWATRDFDGLERVLTQGRVQLLYLSLLLWPSPARLNLDHDFTVSRGLFEPPTTALALLFWLAAALGAVRLARSHPRYGFPLLAYLGLHLIESAPLNLELVFEHRMYLPTAFLSLLAAVAVHDATGRRLRVTAVTVLGVALLLAVQTWRRNSVWADPMAFALDIARKSPDKPRPQYNLGTRLGMAGRTLEARAALLRAAELDPNDSATRNQLANTYLATGDLPLALEHYRRAVELAPKNAEALYNLGMLLDQLGRRQEAEPYLRRFIEAAPPWLEATAEEVGRTLAGWTEVSDGSVEPGSLEGTER